MNHGMVALVFLGALSVSVLSLNQASACDGEDHEKSCSASHECRAGEGEGATCPHHKKSLKSHKKQKKYVKEVQPPVEAPPAPVESPQ